MEYLFYLLKMESIKRKARVIPFGYKLAEDTDYIEPVQEELDALEEAKQAHQVHLPHWMKKMTNFTVG